MKLKLSLAALSLALFAASAFATTTPAASTDPAAAPAATTDASAAPTPKKATSKPHHAKLHCKAGEAAVKGKCEKKPA